MGYLRFKTNLTGEIIVDASRVLTVRLASGNIDLVTGESWSASGGSYGQLRVQGSNLDEATKNRFIDAIIEAQSAKVVVVLPKGDETFNNVQPDPA